MLRRIVGLVLCFCILFEQGGFAQAAGEIDISGHLAKLHGSITSDKFRPLHLRYLSYDPDANNFNLLLDKGDFLNGLSPRPANPKEDKGVVPGEKLQQETKALFKYFFIGISLPNEAFWVNLRPDSPDNIIDDELAKTDVGRIFLEADLQLKKDTALATSPQTPEGREYWGKLYKKAEEFYGTQAVEIPTLTRPWIVPDEIIIRETKDSARIYKATLKVLLEQDYLKNSAQYSFKDERSRELNEYSSQLIRELIIPKLTKEINSSKLYAPLRQVYYSLILAQWFKARHLSTDKNQIADLINSKDLTGLASKQGWSKTSYFNAYKRSFAAGEYDIRESVYTPTGQVIRSYMSGGMQLTECVPPLDQPFNVGHLQTLSIAGQAGRFYIWGTNNPDIIDGELLSASPLTKAVLNTAEDDISYRAADSDKNPSAPGKAGIWPRLRRFAPSFKTVIYLAVITANFFVPGLSYAHYFVSRAMALSSVPQAWAYSNPSENTLWGIARDILKANGARQPGNAEIQNLIEDIVSVNPEITNPDLIYPGQSINIPPEYATSEAMAHLMSIGKLRSESGSVFPQESSEGAPVTQLNPFEGRGDPEWGGDITETVNSLEGRGDFDIGFDYSSFMHSPYFLWGAAIIGALTLGVCIYRWWKGRRTDSLFLKQVIGEPSSPKDDPWFGEAKQKVFNINFDTEAIKGQLYIWKDTLFKASRRQSKYVDDEERIRISNIARKLSHDLIFCPEVVANNLKQVIKIYQELSELSLQSAANLRERLEAGGNYLDALTQESLRLAIGKFILLSDYYRELENNADLVLKIERVYSYKWRLKEGRILGRSVVTLVGQRLSGYIERGGTELFRFFRGMHGWLLKLVLKKRLKNTVFDKGNSVYLSLYGTQMQEKIKKEWLGWFEKVRKDPPFMPSSDMSWKNRSAFGTYGSIIGFPVGTYTLIYTVNQFVTTGVFSLTKWQLGGLFAFCLGGLFTVSYSWYLNLPWWNNKFNRKMKKKIAIFEQGLKYASGIEAAGEGLHNGVALGYKKTVSVLDKPWPKAVIVAAVDRNTSETAMEEVRKHLEGLLGARATIVFVSADGSLRKLSEAYDYLYFSEEFMRIKNNDPDLNALNITDIKKVILLMKTTEPGFRESLKDVVLPDEKVAYPRLSCIGYSLLRGLEDLHLDDSTALDRTAVRFTDGLSVGYFTPGQGSGMFLEGTQKRVSEVLARRLAVLVPSQNNGNNGGNRRENRIEAILETSNGDFLRDKLSKKPFYGSVEWRKLGQEALNFQEVLALVGGFTLNLEPDKSMRLAGFIANDLRKFINNPEYSDFEFRVAPHFLAVASRIISGDQLSSYAAGAAGGEEKLMNEETANGAIYKLLRLYYHNREEISGCIGHIGYSSPDHDKAFEMPLYEISAASSPLIIEDNNPPGGIDLRRINTVMTASSKATAEFTPVGETDASEDKELIQVQRLINANIIPSYERIREYIGHCGKDLKNRLNGIFTCVSGIFRLEEENGVSSDKEFIDLLASLELAQGRTQ